MNVDKQTQSPKPTIQELRSWLEGERGRPDLKPRLGKHLQKWGVTLEQARELLTELGEFENAEVDRLGAEKEKFWGAVGQFANDCSWELYGIFVRPFEGKREPGVWEEMCERDDPKYKLQKDLLLLQCGVGQYIRVLETNARLAECEQTGLLPDRLWNELQNADESRWMDYAVHFWRDQKSQEYAEVCRIVLRAVPPSPHADIARKFLPLLLEAAKERKK